MDVLFPTLEELESLRRELDPTERVLDLLVSMLRYPAEGSMAEFFMEGEDVELAMEDDCAEFNYIEDDILNMRREISGFRMPRGLRAKCNIIEDYSGIDLGKKVSWDEI